MLEREKQTNVNILDQNYFARVRDIARQFVEDCFKGRTTPSLEIPDDVPAGIVAQQLNKQSFALYIDYAGQLYVAPI